MTNVLIITNKKDVTSDFIVRRLTERGIRFYRFNTDELTISIDISLDFKRHTFMLYDRKLNKTIDILSFSAVYFRRPELPLLDSLKNITDAERNLLRSEIIHTLEGVYKILNSAYWVSPIYAIREAENKIYQQLLARKIGFGTPMSVISNINTDINNFIELAKSTIIKPIKTGLIETPHETSVVFTSELNKSHIGDQEVHCCPVHIQEHIKKKSDIRVTVVGDAVFATTIDSQSSNQTRVDWRRGETILKHSRIKLPIDIENKIIILLKTLNLRFGAIDFILDCNGNYIFLEINPNGQWAWIEKQVGYDISNAIVNLLENESF